MNILITGAAGLIDSEAAIYFDNLGHRVVGVDNNQRAVFFGPTGSTKANLRRVFDNTGHFINIDSDIRDPQGIAEVFKFGNFDAVIHCAAQPSHDKAREMPLEDAQINLMGTLNLLEATRKYAPNATFVFMSTNKVYGDAPNRIDFKECETRYDYHSIQQDFSHRTGARLFYAQPWPGFNESTCIDQSTHSLFGCSKLAADLYVQEYAKSFGLNTVVLRGGCLTGPGHAGVEQHGFLSYLCKTALRGDVYKIYGYKGKQVRDNIHSLDVVRAFWEIIQNPDPGSVYNIGGGRENSVSIIEAIQRIEKIVPQCKPIHVEYVDTPRLGDHICYITDMGKFRARYPGWWITKSLDDILKEILDNESNL